MKINKSMTAMNNNNIDNNNNKKMKKKNNINKPSNSTAALYSMHGKRYICDILQPYTNSHATLTA